MEDDAGMSTHPARRLKDLDHSDQVARNWPGGLFLALDQSVEVVVMDHAAGPGQAQLPTSRRAGRRLICLGLPPCNGSGPKIVDPDDDRPWPRRRPDLRPIGLACDGRGGDR